MIGNNYLLWENDDFVVKTPFNPHMPYSEGLHIVVAPKKGVRTAWDDPALSGRAFELAARVAKVAESLNLAPWFNIQANGNWGLLPKAEPFFHIHIYGRNQTKNWGKPVSLPEAPNTYRNEPMPEANRLKLSSALLAASL
jgi:diadenosine tetraphosphate (Ap4A) HIT family hydrolase